MTLNNLRRGLSTVGCILVLAAPALAQQQWPVWEVFGGFQVVQAHVREYYKSTPVIYSIRNQQINLPGADIAVTENISKRIGGTLEFAFHTKSPLMTGTTTRELEYSILYGPRVNFRMHGLVPYFQVLMGAVHSDVRVTPVGPQLSKLGFGASAGVGVDIPLGTKIAFRPFQLEYYRADLLGSSQMNYRGTAGVSFYFGRKK